MTCFAVTRRTGNCGTEVGSGCKDTQLRLTQVRREEANPRLTASQLEEIISETRHKEVADRNRLFRGKVLFYGCICLILLISGLLWLLLT